jgi:phosphatidylethanolamine-binding protein (PEBP) family uncharacterized protein
VNGQNFSNDSQLIANPPSISLPPNSILIMYDPDAPNPSYLHWISVNGTSVIPYQSPNPPKGALHRYIFEVYDNPNRILLPPINNSSRSGFQKDAFTKGMTLVGRTQFTFQRV